MKEKKLVEYGSNTGELVESKNRDLETKKSDLIRLGLELINEIEKQKVEVISMRDKVANVTVVAMKILVDKGVPYHKGIKALITDFEFHYQCEVGQGLLSSAQEAILFLHTDVKWHSEGLELNYEIGKRIFHFWARTFHQADYEKIVNQVPEMEGIISGSEEITHEIKTLLDGKK
jgi:hypothetical protein